MSKIGPEPDKSLDRRTFVKGGLAAGGLLARRRPRHRAAGRRERRRADRALPLGGSAHPAAGDARAAEHPRDPRRPAALPAWFSPTADGTGCRRTCARLRQGAVSFSGHYTASNDCTPARATLLTGLYTHQTGCMITGGSTLDPGFPTWGTMLREHGYQHALVRQVAPHPPRRQVGSPCAAARARALRLRRRHVPLAQRRPRPGLAPGRAHRAAVREVVRARAPAPSRGARPSRSSTRTTSPGGTCGATASRPRRARSRVVHAAAGRTSRRPSC